MKKEEFIQKIAGYVKKYRPYMESKYAVRSLHRQFWNPAGENLNWQKSIIIILG